MKVPVAAERVTHDLTQACMLAQCICESTADAAGIGNRGAKASEARLTCCFEHVVSNIGTLCAWSTGWRPCWHALHEF